MDNGRGRIAAAWLGPHEPGADGAWQRSLYTSSAPLSAVSRRWLCRASQQGRQSQFPRPTAKPVTEAVRQAAVIVRRRGRVLLLRWPEAGRFARLWDFPRFPIHSSPPLDIRRELAENVLALTGVVIAPGRQIKRLPTASRDSALRWNATKRSFSPTANSLQPSWKPAGCGRRNWRSAR